MCISNAVWLWEKELIGGGREREGRGLMCGVATGCQKRPITRVKEPITRVKETYY